MKIERLHYFETYEIFQGHKRYKKLGFEVSFDDDIETPRDVYYKLQRLSEELFYESKAAAEKQMGVKYSAGEDTSISLSGVADLIKQINSCTELKVLESYKFIVRNDEDLLAAYDRRYKKLSDMVQHIQNTSNSNT